MRCRKAVHPVVAVVLILVVTILSGVSFQNWYSSYSSEILANSNDQTESFNSIEVESIINNKLYIKSNYPNSFTLFKILDKQGNTLCELNDDIESTLQGDTRLLLTFDNSTFNGTHVKDLSGYGNDGALVNSPIYNNLDCINEYCFNYDYISDSRILVNSSSSVDFSIEDISISAWVKFDSFPETYSGIVTKGAVGGGTKGYSLVYSNVSGYFLFLLSNGTRPWTNSISGNFLDTNKWYNIIAIADRSSNVSFYLNSNFIGTEDISALENENISSSSTNLELSQWSSGWELNGTIDEVAIYSKALTESEVKSLYNSKKAKFYEQILGRGVKEIDLTNCNLENGNLYELLAFTKDGQKIESTFFNR